MNALTRPRRSLQACVAVAFACSASGAMACSGPEYESHVLLLQPVDLVPAQAVILEVSVPMEEETARSQREGVIQARVLRTVRGELQEAAVTVSFTLETSCDYFGPPGSPRYLVGLVRRGPDGQPSRDESGRVVVWPILYRQHWNRTAEQERGIAEFYDGP